MKRTIQSAYQLCGVNFIHIRVTCRRYGHLGHLSEGKIFAYDILFNHIHIARDTVAITAFYTRGNSAEPFILGFSEKLRQGGEPSPSLLKLVVSVRPNINFYWLSLPPVPDRGFEFLHFIRLSNFIKRHAIPRQIVCEDVAKGYLI